MAALRGDWASVEEAALQAFSPLASGAPGLVAVIRRSVRYAAIEAGAGEIVVDKRAFLLGLLAVGLSETPSSTFGNTATWFAAWLRQRVPRDFSADLFGSLLTPTDAVLEGAAGFLVTASASMRDRLRVAVDYATATVKRGAADLRHVIAAMLAAGPEDWSALAALSWQPTNEELAAFRSEFFSRIEGDREPNEDMAAWRAILGPGDGPSIAVTRQMVAGFASDRVAAGRRGGAGPDPLGIDADVQAFARLICLEEAQPPLSIGLFGGWGSGKSTFMERLESSIRRISILERRRRGREAWARRRGQAVAADPAAGSSRFVQRVVQIRFNAWHFADANLWASLTAEFFDQLRSGGFARRGQDIHARLVERVNSHVHSLSETLTTSRAALAEGEKRVVVAQKARDEAVDAAEKAPGETLSQTLIDAVSAAYEKHKPDLVEIGRRGYQDDITRGIDDFVEVARSVQSLGGQVAAVGQAVAARGWRMALACLSIVLLGLAVYAFAAADKSDIVNWMTMAGGWSALAGIASAAAALLPAIRIVGALVASTAGFAGKLQQVTAASLKDVLAKEAALTAAVKEAQARRDAVDRASRALARYIDPRGTANPPRLLRFVLEDDPDTKAIDKEIGLISRARRLFQAVDEIVKEERRKRAAGAPGDLDVPDRIVLYIDDLDRCTYAQVYAVLQAIHLLLAFELFVVVVGVDVKWIQDALAAQVGSGDPARREEEATPAVAAEIDKTRRKRAIAYLEKIFQLPFWLRPLNAEATGGGSYGAYVRELLAANLEAPERNVLTATAQRVAALAAPGGAAPPGGPVPPGDGAPPDAGAAAAEITFALDQALATVRLTEREVAFLASPAIGGLAAKDPRGVKRLVNVYRIVRARLAGADLQDLLGEGGRLPTYPVIILLAAVETGQDIDVADGLYDGLKKLPPDAVIDDAVTEILEPGGQIGLDLRRPDVWQRLAALRPAFEHSAALAPAIAAACAARGDKGITAGDCLRLARIVRRYSFNRYH